MKHARVKVMALIWKPLGKFAAHDQHALMRPECLIGRKHVNIRAQLADIWKAMRGIAYAIDAHISPGGMHQRCDRFDIVDLAYDVGTMRKADQPCAIKQWRQIVSIQMPSIGIYAPFANRYSIRRQPAPGPELASWS